MAARKKPSRPRSTRSGGRRSSREVPDAGGANKLRTTVADVARVLERLEHPSAIIGGIAVIAWGHGRATTDVDCAIAAPISSAAELLKIFDRAGFEPRYEGALAFAEQNFLMPLRHRKTGVSVDVSLAQLRFEYEALSHAVTLPFLKTHIRVPPVTDLLIYKLVAGRPQDISDAQRLLSLGHTVDHSRVERALREFDEILDTNQLSEWRRLRRNVE